jgi:hypothetical protein
MKRKNFMKLLAMSIPAVLVPNDIQNKAKKEMLAMELLEFHLTQELEKRLKNIKTIPSWEYQDKSHRDFMRELARYETIIIPGKIQTINIDGIIQ